MENKGMRNKFGLQNKIQAVCLVLLSLFLLAAITSIAKQFMRLNASVEYERSVFVSQLAEQMKNNVMASKKNHLEIIHNFAGILNEVQPESFEEVCRLFPDYADSGAVNKLFFLSSQCELYGMDGVKQWVSLSYEGYFLEAVSQKYTSDFIRIGMEREFMVYSTLLSAPITIDGQEISAVLYAWDSSEYRTTLSSILFEAKSSSILIGMEGNIVIYPEGKESESYGYNVFTYLANRGMSEKDLDTIKKLMKEKENTTILCEVEGSRWLFSVAYHSDSYRILVMLPIQNTSAGTYKSLYSLLAAVAASLLILFLVVGVILSSATWRRRVQREKELQTELLMKTAQAKNEFLAKMSHDIRTPLNGIIGMNYIASSKLPPECTEVVQCLKRVDVSAKYLLGILNDILDMSKIESGKLELAVAPFSLQDLKESIEPIIFSQLGEKKIRFIMSFPEYTDCDYIGDELRIKQILINLLSNAVKFTEEGSVALVTGIRNINDEKDELIFTVRDTGKGMTKVFLKHMFSPFTQEDTSIAARYGGSGLGLSIVKSFVDMMDGEISVTSEINKGSEFVVALPMMRTEREGKTEDVERDLEHICNFSGKTVLLCEDNDLNAEIAVMILEEDFGLKVVRSENGRVGLEHFKCSAPGEYAMIFMDVRMPEMDGYEATRAIRALERPDAKEIPICALSANAFSDDIQQSIAAGMNEHLAKPLEVNLLAAVLRKYLN